MGTYFSNTGMDFTVVEIDTNVVAGGTIYTCPTGAIAYIVSIAASPGIISITERSTSNPMTFVINNWISTDSVARSRYNMFANFASKKGVAVDETNDEMPIMFATDVIKNNAGITHLLQLTIVEVR